MVRLLFLIALAWTLTHTDAAEPNPTSETVAINGIRLHYTVRGNGPPLLLVHGYGGSGNDWQHLIPEFEPHFKLILPDLRGHGKSTFTADRFTHRQAAKDVIALLDKLKIRSVSAVGNSTGAMTLLHIATLAPERVQAMVLHSATPYFPSSAREIMATVKINGETALGDYFGDERMARVHSGGKEQHEWLRRSFFEMKDSYEDMNFTPPLLGTISASTLIIHGDRDEFFPIEMPVTLYKNIPNAKLWVVPGQGHNGAFDPERPGHILAGLPFVSTCLAQLKIQPDEENVKKP